MLHSLLALSRPRAPYIGQVTTGCNANDLTGTFASVGTAVRQGMVRSPQKMKVKTPWFQVGIGNWGLSGGQAEQVPGAALSLANMFLEYPLGTIAQRIFWGGGNSASIASNVTGWSDMTPNPVPEGGVFAVRYYMTSTAAVPFHVCSGGINTVNGEAFEWASSGITDKSASGTVGVTDGTITSRPVGIRGPTTQRSFGLVGNSRVVAVADQYTLGSMDVGELGRSIGAYFANVVLACSGDGAGPFNASHARRLELILGITSDTIVADTINELAGGSTAAQCEASMQTLSGYIGRPHRTWLATLTPVAASDTVTDGTINPKRVTYNAWARGVPPGFAGCLDIADAVEKARDNGLIKTGYSDDFVHLNQVGNLGLFNAQVIQPWRFRPY